MQQLSKTRQDIIDDIDKRLELGALEISNANLLKKLITNAESDSEAEMIAMLGTTWRKTGLYFEKRLENYNSQTIHYFKKNEELSFRDNSQESKNINKLIIGDNFSALQNLLISYRGKIDVIYIDPPYGKDSLGEFAKMNYNNDLTRDNLLSILYPRLFLAKQLLSTGGIIYCSIDDKNYAYIKCLFDEIFDEKNCICTLPTIMNLKGNNSDFAFSGTHEYTIVYAKNIDNVQLNEFSLNEDEIEEGNWLQDDIGDYKKGATIKRTGQDGPRENRPLGYFPILVRKEDKIVFTIEESEYKQIYNPDTKTFNDDYVEELRKKYSNEYFFILPESDGIKTSWRWGFKTVIRDKNEIIVSDTGNELPTLYKKQRPVLQDFPTRKPKTLFYKAQYSSGNGTNQQISIFGKKVFDNPKPIDLINDLIYLASGEDSIVLDFFAGSATTGHSVLDLNKFYGGNRTFILCQLNENKGTTTTPNGIAYDVTYERLKRVMTGVSSNGESNFEWAKKNSPYGGNLDVYEIKSVSNVEDKEGESAFDVIDETLYNNNKFSDIKDKINWVCENFEQTQDKLKSKSE